MSFWDVVIITASSERQAGIYREEIQRRNSSGLLPCETKFLVVPDPGGQRVGSGGATINALGILGKDRAWWSGHRALLVHSGGDSRRLPQYSPGGKLFGILPLRTQPRATTTVFDETMSLSSAWAEKMRSGLLVASGDVVLHFDAGQVQWNRPGVTGVAMRLDMEQAVHHGVYAVGADDQVYTFLQKPSPAEVKAAGGLLQDGRVAVDIGLLRFDADLTAALTELAGFCPLEAFDVYDEFTRMLTGQWRSEAEARPFWRELESILRGTDRPVAFHCSVVEGEFIHAGTTHSFRALASGSGGILDSIIAGECRAGHEAVILECDLEGPVYASRGAILHGLTGLSGLIEVPEDTVVHQLPIDGECGAGWVIRAYGVEDDPKQPFESATWFNRPMAETLERLGLRSEEIWKANEPRNLWGAALFPITTPGEAWACARWMMGYSGSFGVEQWRQHTRTSLAECAHCADGKALADARNRRMQGIWQETAVDLAKAGSDLRPLLANLPGLGPAAAAGRALRAHADRLRAGSADQYTLAASHLVQAARLLGRAGREAEAVAAEAEAFTCIQDAVRAGANVQGEQAPRPWQFEQVRVSAPARIDLGGGWSDTPPFCFDWGGTVLNCALEIDGTYPIETEIRRIDEPVIRSVAGGEQTSIEYRRAEELRAPCEPGSVYAIPRAALYLHGIPVAGEPLEDTLRQLGGGIEIRCRVQLPIGSGLGTSSILGATVVRALAVMSGRQLDDHALSESVIQLEQHMTTGGGWQDQAGGIFPGAKLLITGPGLRQYIRVQPVPWSGQRRAEFCAQMVLYNTGLQRMAKDLLRQVVARYLARETATVQVLHSIKTLAVEMSYAMVEGDWKHLGELLDRHWQLNQVLDPNTANAPINAVLDRARPYIFGAKLAGAGGGGFLMLLARDPEAAAELRTVLDQERPHRGASVPYWIAEDGLRVHTSNKSARGDAATASGDPAFVVARNGVASGN